MAHGRDVIPALRTLLFVPGDQPRRIAKAYASGADAVAIDLEDAVAPAEKPAARATVAEAVAAQAERRCLALVRVNAVASGLVDDDLDALAPVLGHVDGLIVAMVAGPDDVRHVAGRLDGLEREAGLRAGGVVLVPLVETAGGVLRAEAVAAASDRVLTLALGPADLSDELGVELTPEGGELLHARSHLVLAARTAGRIGPIDGPWLALDDDAGLAVAARAARRLGFGGKQTIHPRQLAAVREAFAVGPEELRWAHRVERAFREAEAAGTAAIRLEDGTFVDPPVARRARAIIDAAEG